jgi:vancomycin resistance protein VanW
MKAVVAVAGAKLPGLGSFVFCNDHPHLFMADPRTYLRMIIPRPLRREWACQQRNWQDRRAGIRFAEPAPLPQGQRVVSLTQPIFPTEGSQAKVHNLQLAAARIRLFMLPPGRTFSFWRVVGRPTSRRGFRRGRNIVNGSLTLDYGGGLCQMAGLLYHLSLLGQLTITERHAHTRDLYRENERYTPLGADATVVYGYKDLRVRNDGAAPVWFSTQISDDALQATLWSTKNYTPASVIFARVVDEPRRARVHTIRDGQLVAVSEYLR